MTKDVTRSGESKFAFNIVQNEAACCHYSRDEKVGKKLVLSNCFEIKPEKNQKAKIAIFDEYHVTFSGCDNFNKMIFGRCWPFRQGGNYRTGEVLNCWNYLFTSTLINVYSYHENLNGSGCSQQMFNTFLDELACEIVKKVC